MGFVIVVACCLAIGLATAENDHPTTRPKRSLVYPNPSTLLLIFGLGTPLQLERESVIVGAFTKMIYALPTNSTDFTEPGVEYRKGSAPSAPTSRWSLYRSLARLAELYGFGEGRACVMRSVCEAAAAPFDPRRGLLHQLLQTFLSPSTSDDKYEEYADRQFHAAERLGRRERQAGCHALYPECHSSLLDVFSSAHS